MQPVKITLKGDYYDCQIYRGRLYLWTFDGALKVYNWNQLIQSLIKEDSDRIALTCCFLDGNYLYKSSLIELFKDADFKELLVNKYKKVEENNYELTENELDSFLFGEQDVPTGVLPTDTEIYSNKLYFINEKGLFSSSAHRTKSDKFPVSSKPSKLWDCNLLSIKANKYPQLALSGGNEGLFELNMASNLPSNLKRMESKNPIFQVSDKHSSFSNYSFLNIYNTSLIENSFLALFKWNVTTDNLNLNKPIRDFEGNISEDEIFNTKNERHFISWGIEDKIYKATDYGFEIIKYNNYAKKENGDEQFSRLNSFKFHTWKGNIINGGSSYFGNIVECENALIVVQSDEKIFTINGPVTKWRVYPRSMNYENHLHVILDDRIEIYSFNQDYFVNQENKEIGIQFNNQKHLKRPSSYNKISKKIYNNVDLSGEITENLNSNHFDILESDDLPF